jgi:activator of 2-hydroxyglutaryl-CoA dehydratase
MEPEFTLIGGILRFETMVRVARQELHEGVNVPPGDLVQFVSALGAARLGFRRLEQIAAGDLRTVGSIGAGAPLPGGEP